MAKSSNEIASDITALLAKARNAIYATGSVPELIQLVKEQDRTIEYLKNKVERLQDELDKINDY